MQSIYVLPMGFMFAYLAYKYDSVIPAIIAHILNNRAGIIIPALLGRNLNNTESFILFVLFMIPTVLIGRRLELVDEPDTKQEQGDGPGAKQEQDDRPGAKQKQDDRPPVHI